ncbi:hypothetical protein YASMINEVIRUS_1480 [Yasminevirus sp. GU-2018]|uniref:Uncharacterized protein n=1 Tax=Yasminevirus sp. GU-2018 TaxID=2420051 RepID=A0A5K0UAA6_9VIRU|nr:hypothetical protein YASMINEVIRUS_1480 [Yasminevirus sp. GU-2018]
MNLTYSLIGCQLIKLVRLVVWALKYISCVYCKFVSSLVCKFNCTVENFCCNGTRTICGVCTSWCFFLSKRTKNSIANLFAEFVACWARIIVKIIETIEKIFCEVLPLCYFHILDYFVAIFVLAVTWVTKTIDWFITWAMCMTYVSDGVNKFGNLFTKEKRLLTLAPVVIVNKEGDSDWFIHVNVQGKTFILGTAGELLVPYAVPKFAVCEDPRSKCLTKSDSPCSKKASNCNKECGDCGEFIYIDATIYNSSKKVVKGEPFTFLSDKVIEITDRLMAGTLADNDDSGSGSDITQFSYITGTDDQYNNHLVFDLPNRFDIVGMKSAYEASNGNPTLDANTKISDVITAIGITNFNKYVRYVDFGVRVLAKDVDDCGNDTSINTHVTVHCDGYRYICNERLADMEPCHTFDINDYKFLLGNKHADPSVLTVYFVNRHTEKEGDLSCADLLGYIFCAFNDTDGNGKILKSDKGKSSDPFSFPLTMQTIIGEFQEKTKVVAVAEELIHSVCHQAGLMHTTDEVDDDDMRRDDIVRVMYHKPEEKCKPKPKCSPSPCGKTEHDRLVRRVLTPMEWCMLRDCGYLVRGCKKTTDFKTDEIVPI